MRKTLLVLAICILAVPAWAGGGFSLFGTWTEINEDASAPGAGMRASVGGQHWVGDLTWTWLEGQDGVSTIAGFEDSVQIIPTDLGVRYLFNTQGSFKPYIGAGATFFWVNLNDGDADHAWGGYGILGFSLGKSRARFFAEATYRYGSTDVTYLVTPVESVTGSMDLGGFGVNAGVIWTF
jgi:hypothetical protein